MDLVRHDDHHMGYIVPEGAQRAKYQAVSHGGADLLRSRTDVLDRIGRAEDKIKGRKTEVSEGDGM